MKNPTLAALMSFFFMGLGAVYNGRRVLTGIGWTVASLLLVVVEQAPLYADGKNLQATSLPAFLLLFTGVFIGNTCFAIDAFQEARAINAARAR